MARTSVGRMGTLKKGRENFPPFWKDDSFWRGFASAFDLTGHFTPRYYGRDPQRADHEALKGDWEAIGRDMERAIRRFEKEHAEEIEAAEQKRLFDPDEISWRRTKRRRPRRGAEK
jgi:hypothetical protein